MRINAGTIASLLEADLLSAGWNGCKTAYPGQTPRQAAYASISRSIVKKYLEGTSETSPEADQKALALFTSVNNACRTFNYDTTCIPDWERIALGEAKWFLWDFFYPVGHSRSSWSDQDFILSSHEICKDLNVGPGSSIGSKSTDLYSKFSTSDLSATSSALHLLYVQAVRHNPTWLDVEMFRAERMGYGIAQASRLSFVPKYADISRTICTEPVLNMMFQKGIASVIDRRMRQVLAIDLRNQQSINQKLARIGSITGEFGTIDLTSASDSMSLSLVREFFPPDVVRWLERTRCSHTVLPDGSLIELHMISSMGNAFTFPLQTIFFASLVYGAYRTLDIQLKRSRAHVLPNFAVNGDDIIVVQQAYSLVVRLLQLTGFSVNVDKSFNEGPFRESCGSDYFQGYNIRGVYIKRLRDANDCYSAINRLNRWSSQQRTALPRLVSYLSRKCRFLPIPYDEDDSHGIKVPQCVLPRVWSRHKDTGGLYYRFSMLIPRSIAVNDTVGKAPNIPGWFNNPSGLLFAFLAGNIRDGRIVLRTTERSAKIRRRYSSRWNYIPVVDLEKGLDFESWKAFTVLNLEKV
jgi:hypothetical protein